MEGSDLAHECALGREEIGTRKVLRTPQQHTPQRQPAEYVGNKAHLI